MYQARKKIYQPRKSESILTQINREVIKGNFQTETQDEVWIIQELHTPKWNRSPPGEYDADIVKTLSILFYRCLNIQQRINTSMEILRTTEKNEDTKK